MKDQVNGDHIVMLTVQLFSMAAMWRQAPWWQVQNPELEVRPWADNAAELLNKVDKKYLEKAMTANAALSVTMGIGSMVAVRLMEDQNMALMKQQARRDELRREEGVPNAPVDTSNLNVNGHPPRNAGSGAASVHPGPVAGLGGTGGPF